MIIENHTNQTIRVRYTGASVGFEAADILPGKTDAYLSFLNENENGARVEILEISGKFAAACIHCRYSSKAFEPDSSRTFTDHRKCRRFPPVGGQFPLVKTTDWCGEFIQTVESIEAQERSEQEGS